jgi:hypothetical protein
LVTCAVYLLATARFNCAAQNEASHHELSCPATIDVTETATATARWQAGNATSKRKFERISIYNGQPGGKEFELAPDDQKRDQSLVTQVWHLQGYRTMNLFLRCRYRDTEAVLYRDIPTEFKDCTFVFNVDKSGRITGTPSFACR